MCSVRAEVGKYRGSWGEVGSDGLGEELRRIESGRSADKALTRRDEGVGVYILIVDARDLAGFGCWVL